MICPRCTLLHPEYAVACLQCGRPLRSVWDRLSTQALTAAPTVIGVASGVSLLSCITATLIVPTIAAQALAIGAYFGIISIANIWLSVYRDGEDEWLRGLRGSGYSVALLVSLIAEIARLQHVQSLPFGLPVPSALTTELLAAALIIVDPLVASPLIRWIAEGVERGPSVLDQPSEHIAQRSWR